MDQDNYAQIKKHLSLLDDYQPHFLLFLPNDVMVEQEYHIIEVEQFKQYKYLLSYNIFTSVYPRCDLSRPSSSGSYTYITPKGYKIVNIPFNSQEEAYDLLTALNVDCNVDYIPDGGYIVAEVPGDESSNIILDDEQITNMEQYLSNKAAFISKKPGVSVSKLRKVNIRYDDKVSGEHYQSLFKETNGTLSDKGGFIWFICSDLALRKFAKIN